MIGITTIAYIYNTTKKSVLLCLTSFVKTANCKKFLYFYKTPFPLLFTFGTASLVIETIHSVKLLKQ